MRPKSGSGDCLISRFGQIVTSGREQRQGRGTEVHLIPTTAWQNSPGFGVGQGVPGYLRRTEPMSSLKSRTAIGDNLDLKIGSIAERMVPIGLQTMQSFRGNRPGSRRYLNDCKYLLTCWWVGGTMDSIAGCGYCGTPRCLLRRCAERPGGQNKNSSCSPKKSRLAC